MHPADRIWTSPPQAFHLKVRSVWIAAAPVLTLHALNATRPFQCHNLFLQLHNFLEPALGQACGLTSRASVFSQSSVSRTPIRSRVVLSTLEVEFE